MADDKGGVPEDDGSPGGRDGVGNRSTPSGERRGGATGSERASDLSKGALGNRATRKETYRTSRAREAHRPRTAPRAYRSGATPVERAKKGFNPAWLLVPAGGLLVGGLGIANIDKKSIINVSPI